MPWKIYKLLRMTYNYISEFFGLVSGAWRPSKCLVKEKGVASPNYTAIIKRRSDKWNFEWPAPLSLSLSLSLSLGCPVIVNICIINASTVERKCLCCQEWRRSQIFRNLFGEIILGSTFIFALSFRKVKTNIWKKSKKLNTSVNHAPKNKFYN